LQLGSTSASFHRRLGLSRGFYKQLFNSKNRLKNLFTDTPPDRPTFARYALRREGVGEQASSPTPSRLRAYQTKDGLLCRIFFYFFSFCSGNQRASKLSFRLLLLFFEICDDTLEQHHFSALPTEQPQQR